MTALISFNAMGAIPYVNTIYLVKSLTVLYLYFRKPLLTYVAGHFRPNVSYARDIVNV